MDALVEEVRKRRRKLMTKFDCNPRRVLETLEKEREKYLDRLACPSKIKSSGSDIRVMLF